MMVKSPQDPQARTRRKLDLSLHSKCQVFTLVFDGLKRLASCYSSAWDLGRAHQKSENCL